jgi:hypothetical protein
MKTFQKNGSFSASLLRFLLFIDQFTVDVFVATRRFYSIYRAYSRFCNTLAKKPKKKPPLSEEKGG